jgi:hypothetical protein
MSEDTHRSVTVIGEIYFRGDGNPWELIIDELPADHPFADGDLVDVTIRKYQSLVHVWPQRGRGGATEEEISELGIEPDGIEP